jgi:hypothetical protein
LRVRSFQASIFRQGYDGGPFSAWTLYYVPPLHTVKTKWRGANSVDAVATLAYTPAERSMRKESLMQKNDVRKSQSFTYSEISVGIEIMRFAMRSNDLKVLSQRPDFISLYRKFSRMRDKMDELFQEATESES